MGAALLSVKFLRPEKHGITCLLVTALSYQENTLGWVFPSVCINTLKIQTKMFNSCIHTENTSHSFPLTFSSWTSNTASWTLQAKSEVGKSLKSIISSKSSSFSPKIICSSSSWSLLYRSDWLSLQDFMESLSILAPQQLLLRCQLPTGPCQPKKTQKQTVRIPHLPAPTVKGK